MDTQELHFGSAIAVPLVEVKSAKRAGVLSRTFVQPLSRLIGWLVQLIASSIILSILIFIVVNFYVFSSIVNLDSFFYIFLILSLLTDGLFVFVHLPRHKTAHAELQFDPSKLTIVIACHNGADVIAETVRQAHAHVPLDQIIVVSDFSSDDTVSVARATGATVVQNKRNLNKAFTISAAMKLVQTPYVLILDDDTLIEKTFIPTSLLDDGYTAVAFNVMPVAESTIINAMQRFEYRGSMQMGKNLRAGAGAIGNVSGAIGLFRTTDLKRQVTLHSGQFAGEDEQRTMLAHMHGEGKGITYTDALVETLAPQTFRSLFKQRAYSWSLAVPELFTLYWRMLLSPRYHYLLKAEKAYQLYFFLTDPLRLLFFWTLFLRPSHALVTYGFYLALNILIWIRTGARDPFWTVILFPIYSLILTIARFIGQFHWLRVKARFFRKGFHKLVPERRLILEALVVVAVIALAWGVSINRFASDIKLFNKIRNNRLEEPVAKFSYENDSTAVAASPVTMFTALPAAPATGTYLEVALEKGDTARAIAHKSVEAALAGHPEMSVPYASRAKVDATVAQALAGHGVYYTSTAVLVDYVTVTQAITTGQGG